jgi:DNA processing protein
MVSDELASWLRLLLTPGVGPVSARKLLAAFGLPQAVFQQSPLALRAVVGPQATQALLSPPAELDATLARLNHWLAEAPNRHVLTLGDARFPPELLQMADPPLLLYVAGQLDALHHPRRLAMVGSRNPTPQGQANARQFARALGEAGVCVVSGLALGVDGAAHEGALDADAPTIAVVGTGLDRVYPKNHRDLAHRILVRGALVSEYGLGTPPLPANFPQRNRLIAGLSQGTLVVEAAVQSGSLITARLAAEQGREVFAIPGSIHAPQSRGCHALIRQGAKLVESAQDILEDLRITTPAPAVATAAAAANDLFNPAESAEPDALLDAMGFDPVSLDALQARTGLPTATLQARLLELELQGDVGRLPGGLLQRLGLG